MLHDPPKALTEDWMRRGFLVVAVLSLGALSLGGCAQTTALTRKPDGARPASPRILVMPSDVQLSELTAGGMLEPKAEWTEKAQGHIAAALRRHLEARNARLVPYEAPETDRSRAHRHVQLLKLHDAVGGAIIFHKYGPPQLRLPTKEDFDWTLGRGATALRDEYGADYALFVLFRDTYASAGRVALIVGAAILGVGLPAGQQVGFASLVDLQTGDVAWFNRLLDPSGDLRSGEPARKAVDKLLAELPL
jgi:hypothetical protein